MLVSHIELILLLTGLATSGALVMCLAPTLALKTLFGKASSDAVSLLIARHWGLLIFLVGALLIYAAYHAEIRVSALVLASAEKTAFALGVFASPLRRCRMAFVAALADAGMAALYLIYLAGPWCGSAT
jgi:hypothetical protein